MADLSIISVETSCSGTRVLLSHLFVRIHSSLQIHVVCILWYVAALCMMSIISK